jgi:hypothetical protein
MWQNSFERLAVSFQRSAIGVQLLVVMVAGVYAWQTWSVPAYAVRLALNVGEKPFILRPLVPWLAQGLMRLGIPAWVALTVLVAASAWVLFGALQQAPLSVTAARWRAVLVAFGLMGITWHSRIYDVPSALFVALGLVWMWRRDWSGYGLIFALGSLNRETMILLGLVYAVHFTGKLDLRTWLWVGIYQLYLFVVIRAGVMVFYAEAPGAPLWFTLWDNVRWHMEQPWLAVLHWALIGCIIWLCLRKLEKAEPLVRTAFMVWVPVLLGLYVTLGLMGEVRVFAEALPVIISSFRFQVSGVRSVHDENV